MLYPLFADLSERAVLVVGGGDVAARKVSMLLRAGAKVTVGAPHLLPELREQAQHGQITHLHGAYDNTWQHDMWLVIAATRSRALNARIASDAHTRHCLVNVVDDPALSSFQVPAVIDRSPLMVAISSGGVAPVLARRLRERIESLLDPALGPLLQLAQRYRARIRARHEHLGARRRFYDWLHDGPVFRALRSAQPLEAERALQAALLASNEAAQPGSVVLVGAGPGDPGLLTLRALRALNEADVILHDELVDARVLELARRDADRISVGKRGGGKHTPQEQIHASLLDHARAGKRVVRLKGGDPFVFGRGGEELQFLHAHGIATEVVPGVTAALACAAFSGIPLTHRDHAQSVRLLTAHCRESLDTLDWAELARERQTLAIYMGVSRLSDISANLIAHGRRASTPFALIENGSLPEQRTLLGELGDLPALAERHGMASPALLVIGEVAALGASGHWFGQLLGAQAALANAA